MLYPFPSRRKVSAGTPPKRHWRSYGNDPLPTGAEALDEPLNAFPSWFLRIVCERCGEDLMFSETNSARDNMLIRDILERMRQTVAAGGQGRWSCSPASKRRAVGRCERSCCWASRLPELPWTCAGCGASVSGWIGWIPESQIKLARQPPKSDE
jgi:hypothetical protein